MKWMAYRGGRRNTKIYAYLLSISLISKVSFPFVLSGNGTAELYGSRFPKNIIKSPLFVLFSSCVRFYSAMDVFSRIDAFYFRMFRV